ncbi:MAG: hypothetical protein K0Q55_582 [Verrucomicrobia bacterium]|jgi:hypothetical protein|nr:hypothetical protein [Verrucomicrobiota bacterium]
MLTINGNKSQFCDGVSRRNFLRIGALGLGGLALPQLLQAEAQSGRKSTQKSIIMIYLPGGPPHQDMFDLKMEAPKEIRGEFKPISTKVPGIQICEHLPKLAAMMDKMSIIRSMVGSEGGHDNFQCFTGRSQRNQPAGGWPTFGSIISKLQGPVNPAVPPFVGLENRMQHRPYNMATPGYLGVPHQSFRPEGDGKADMVLNGVTTDRLSDRRALLTGFDKFRRDVDSSGLMEGVDAFTQQAFGMLTSSKLSEALDYQKEGPKLVARYGVGDKRVRGDAAPMQTEQFLIARRLVEAGARVVTVAFGFWDYHGNNFTNCKNDLPLLDRGVTALIQDLHERGLANDVSVVVWGEFGRTPTINKDAGRDHWPNVSCALLAGGGMKHGQVIGATDRLGGEAVERPVTYSEVFSTLYSNIGIDVNTATVNDLTGRPQYIVEPGSQPMKELIA